MRFPNPNVVFLIETMTVASRDEEVLRRIAFGCALINKVGRSGVLAFLLKNLITCEVINCYRHFINVEFIASIVF